jgi:hypothetical protein
VSLQPGSQEDDEKTTQNKTSATTFPLSSYHAIHLMWKSIVMPRQQTNHLLTKPSSTLMKQV